MDFRQTCVFTNMLPLNKPQVQVSHTAEKFDSNGQLTDEKTRQYVSMLTKALLDWTRRLHYGRLMVEIGNQAKPMMESLLQKESIK